MFCWQYLLPKHWLSKLMFKFTRWNNRWVYTKFTHWFIRTYNVDMQSAKIMDIDAYQNFNAFFTRALKDGIRPIGKGLVSPVDGKISQSGSIKNGILIQAKGKEYSLNALLGNDNKFKNFATIYLSPKDYHRVHAPLTGRLLKMDYIGGSLFSVNAKTANSVDNLFARNERVICYFDTYTLILVGAIFVGSIQTVWHGLITPPYGKRFSIDYQTQNIELNKGDELGQFNMGSTVILLSNTHTFNLPIGGQFQLGQSLSV